MSKAPGHTTQDAVASLIGAADTDTLFRDIYLRRARALIAPRCSATRYHAIRNDVEEIARLLQHARAAMARQDWEQVRDLGARAETLQRAVDADAATMDLARLVYEASPVALDPFSPGLGREVGGRDPSRAHAELQAALDALATADADCAALYRARRDAMARLGGAGDGRTAAQPAATGAGDAEKRARQALEAGDADALRRAAEEMLRGTAPAAPTATGSPAGRTLTTASSLGTPFPPAAVERAVALGLEPATAEPGAAAAAVAEFIQRNAWRASPATLAGARDGIVRVREAFQSGALPPELAEAAADVVAQFALQLYVNSAGLRFVPLPVAKEHVLVETFAEAEESPSALLEALGLPGRRAIARATIEAQLLERGATIVQERLGLEPDAYRLVCIPADVYVRLGMTRGWGRREAWTHFDGYQVMRGGSLRALVGGNARFGGLADLCSIGTSDERENVTARFAVVRRDRLAVRL
jgi:hypothetical protein